MSCFARFIGITVCIFALLFGPGCPHGKKDRVCAEFREVMSQWGDPSGHAENWRRGAKVLEGLRGVPEVDAHRLALEKVADAVEAMQSSLRDETDMSASYMNAYQQAHEAMQKSSTAFHEYCYG